MTQPIDDTILAALVIFCRSGCCIMTLPGFSNEHVPMRVRLYIAIGVTIPLALSLVDVVKPHISGASMPTIAVVVVTEALVGVLLGFLTRLFLMSLETLATAVVMAIGLGNVFGGPVNSSEPTPAMASFVVFGATTLIFVTDQHWELIRGLHLSYSAVPIMAEPTMEGLLREFLKALAKSYLLVLRLGSPFLLFALITNLAFGFLNRMAPQAPVYFVSAPLLIFLGTYWFYLAAPDFFSAFSADFGAWILRG